MKFILLKGTIQWLLEHLQNCKLSPLSNSRTFSSPEKENPCLLDSHSRVPLLLGDQEPTLCVCRPAYSGHFHQWTHPVVPCLLLSLSIMFSGSVNVGASLRASVLLRGT